MSILTINGVTDDDLGLVATRIGPAWSAPTSDRASTAVLGRLGVVAGLVARGREKRIPLSLKLSGDLSERRANFNTVMAHLDGLLQLEWTDAVGYAQFARLDTVGARALYESQAYVLGELLLDLELILDAPVLLALSPSVIGVSSTAANLAGLGTLPCSGKFYFPPTTANLTITYKHGLTRETITTLTLSGSTGAGLALEVDCARETLYTWSTTTGARVSVLSLYSSGDFPVFDPGDGDTSYPPTIESNHSGVVHYRGVTA
jgi:phage-related protein